jgi:hypothetical protein
MAWRGVAWRVVNVFNKRPFINLFYCVTYYHPLSRPPSLVTLTPFAGFFAFFFFATNFIL